MAQRLTIFDDPAAKQDSLVVIGVAPPAMTHARSGAARSAAGQRIRSSSWRSDRHVARVFAELLGVDLIGHRS